MGTVIALIGSIILTGISFITVYTLLVFIGLSWLTPWFIIGTIIYILGTILYSLEN